MSAAQYELQEQVIRDPTLRIATFHSPVNIMRNVWEGLWLGNE